ncbi:MAG: LPXTG cell wall anchor domain-containing protein [Acidimicrobiia bacterium]
MTTLRRRTDRQAEHRGRASRFSAVVAVLLALSVIAAGCDSSSDSSSSKPKSSVKGAEASRVAYTPVGPEIAVGEYVASLGHEYAGPCDLATLPRDEGKWCSTLVESKSTDNQKVYDVGPVGGKAEKTITLKRRGQQLLVPGENVPVENGDIGDVGRLTYEQLLADQYVTDNLKKDLAAGIGKGISELDGVAGAVVGRDNGTGGNAGNGGNGGNGGTNIITSPGNTVDANGYPVTGGIVVDQPTVAGDVVFRGTGCAANEPLTVYFDGTPIGTIAAGTTGDFAGQVAIPSGTSAGTHVVTIKGATCESTFTVDVSGQLAFTGSSSHTSTFVLGGVAAILVGLVLILATRRRRRQLHLISTGAGRA